MIQLHLRKLQNAEGVKDGVFAYYTDEDRKSYIVFLLSGHAHTVFRAGGQYRDFWNDNTYAAALLKLGYEIVHYIIHPKNVSLRYDEEWAEMVIAPKGDTFLQNKKAIRCRVEHALIGGYVLDKPVFLPEEHRYAYASVEDAPEALRRKLFYSDELVLTEDDLHALRESLPRSGGLFE